MRAGLFAAMVSVAVAAGLPAGVTAADRGGRCAAAGSRTVAGNAVLRVYRVEVDALEDVFLACEKRTGRRRVVTRTGRTAGVNSFRVRGRVVGYAVTRCSPDGEVCSARAATIDLADGARRVFEPRCCAGRIRDLEVADGRRIAFIGEVAAPEIVYTVSVADAGGTRVVATGGGIGPQSLRLRGDVVSWRENGTTGSERLRRSR